MYFVLIDRSIDWMNERSHRAATIRSLFTTLYISLFFDLFPLFYFWVWQIENIIFIKETTIKIESRSVRPEWFLVDSFNRISRHSSCFHFIEILLFSLIDLCCCYFIIECQLIIQELTCLECKYAKSMKMPTCHLNGFLRAV